MEKACLSTGLLSFTRAWEDSNLAFSLRKSGALSQVLHVFLDVTKLCLSIADDLLNLALRFQLLVAHDLAGEFLDIAFHFVDSALDLILIHAHEFLQMNTL